MWLTRIQRISTTWRPHSEQLKQWVAASGSDIAKLSAARAYASDLRWSQSLDEFDDCTEAVWLLHRIGFTRDSKIFDVLRLEMSDHLHTLNKDGVQTITLLCGSDPVLFENMSALFLTPPEVLPQFREAFRSMSPADKLDFANIFWRCSYSGVNQKTDYWGLNEAVAVDLASLVNKSSTKSRIGIMGQLAEMGAPVWDPTCRELSDALASASAKLSTAEKLDVLAKLAHNASRAAFDSLWFSSLRGALYDGPAKQRPSADQCVLFSALLNAALVPPTSIEINALGGSLAHCGPDALLAFCRSLEDLPRTAVDAWGPRLADAQANLVLDVTSTGTPTRQKAHPLLCLSYTDPEAARAALLSLAPGIDPQPGMPAAEAISWLRCFARLNLFPEKSAAAIVACVNSEHVAQGDGVYLLYALVRLGLEVDRGLVSKASGRSLVRQFSRRRQQQADGAAAAAAGKLDPESLVYLLAALAALSPDACGGLNGEKVAIDVLTESGLLGPGPLTRLLGLLAALLLPESPARRATVTKAVRLVADDSPAAFARAALDGMAAVHLRDAVGYERVLACLRLAAPPVGVDVLLSAAAAAQSLRLVGQFERSQLLETSPGFAYWSREEVFGLAKFCSPAQRRWLMTAPGAREGLAGTAAQAAEQSCAEAVLLFNMVPAGERRQALAALGAAAAAAAAAGSPAQRVQRGELSAEDAVAALEHAQALDTACFELVFRAVAVPFEAATEAQLMRALRCVSLLPACPNYAFRALGGVLLRLSETLSAHNAVLWLDFYTANRIRDDSVGKALVKKASARHVSLSREASASLQRGAAFYGLTLTAHAGKGSKRRKSGGAGARLPS